MQSRFEHIAVPVDFTAKCRGAIEIALELASVNRARTTLIHVVEQLEIDADAEVRTFYDRLEQRARRELDPLCQPFSATGLPAHGVVLFGKRAGQIVEYVRRHAVDLVIMSSHPIAEGDPLGSMATISYQVSIAAPCSVLLVKAPRLL